MSDEKQKQDVSWDEYVRSEIKAILDAYLPETETGNIGIKYSHPIRETYETHTEYDEDKISGVEIRLVFKFIEAIDVIE